MIITLRSSSKVEPGQYSDPITFKAEKEIRLLSLGATSYLGPDFMIKSLKIDGVEFILKDPVYGSLFSEVSTLKQEWPILYREIEVVFLNVCAMPIRPCATFFGYPIK